MLFTAFAARGIGFIGSARVGDIIESDHCQLSHSRGG
jgi:hypothetical protein